MFELKSPFEISTYLTHARFSSKSDDTHIRHVISVSQNAPLLLRYHLKPSSNHEPHHFLRAFPGCPQTELHVSVGATSVPHSAATIADVSHIDGICHPLGHTP